MLANLQPPVTKSHRFITAEEKKVYYSNYWFIEAPAFCFIRIRITQIYSTDQSREQHHQQQIVLELFSMFVFIQSQ